jgi:DNA-directed RNA polymerase specialized sigma24 family protein
MSVRLARAESFKEQADRVSNEHYGSLESEVVAVVRRRLLARKMHLDHADLEGAYCQAWHGVIEEIKRGNKIRNLTGMLVDITWRRAVDAYRESRPAQRAEVDIEAHAVEVDLDQQLDDQEKLQRFIKRLKGRLSEQECEAVGLCLIHGYTRPEARKLLGIKDEARMQKLMDGATKKIGLIVASISARGCGDDEWSRLMRDYALGLLGEEDRDYRRASEHIENCTSCRRYVMGLRGLAAIVPPVGLPFIPAGGHETSILAHLEHLFNGHGGASATASSAMQSTATAGGVSAAGGGPVVLGSLGGAKGVAAVLIAAAAAGVTVIHASGSDHHHHLPARHAHVSRSAPASTYLSDPSASFPASPVTRGNLADEHERSPRPQHGKARRGHGRAARHTTPADAEFGFQGQQTRASTPPPVQQPSNSSQPTSVSAPGSATSVTPAEKEFGPER